MGRWFRRKQKKQAGGEEEAPPLAPDAEANPEEGDEALVAFEHGDIRHPVVLGGLDNGKDKPPTHRDGGETPDRTESLAAEPPNEPLLEPPPESPPQNLEEEATEAEEPEADRKGMFRRLRERLSRTRETLAGGLDRLFAGRQVIDEALLEELEGLLITADLGVDTALHLIQGIRGRVKRRELGEVERLKAALHEEMVALLQEPPPREITSRPWAQVSSQ